MGIGSALGGAVGNYLVPGLGGSIGGALLGSLLDGGGDGSSQSGNMTTTQQQQLDPRIASILFGSGGQKLKPGVQPTFSDGSHVLAPGSGPLAMVNPASDYLPDNGLLGRYQGYLDQPQNAGMAQYGQDAQGLLGGSGAGIMSDMHNNANFLMGGNQNAPNVWASSYSAPQAMAAASSGAANMGTGAQVGQVDPMQAAQAQAAQINAPSQNGTNLAPAYQNMIYGNAGANPYLTGALQSAVNQTNASYDQNQTSATNNLLRNVLPSIRSGAMAVGGYGGSRQGIAEGNALGDFTGQMNNANLQLGLANSANTTGQQATAFNQGQDRSLSAMSGLGAQQYGVATNDAQLQQQTNLENAQLQQQANAANYQGGLQSALTDAANAQGAAQTNAGFNQQTGQTNAGLQQGANQTNYTGQLGVNQGNATLHQGADLANQGAGLSTNALNSSNRIAGQAASSGLLGQAYSVGGNQDAYGLSRAGQVNGLLTPYVGLNGSQTLNQPLYQNKTGNILGSALMGSQLGGLLGNFSDNNGGGQFLSNLVGWGGQNATL